MITARHEIGETSVRLILEGTLPVQCRVSAPNGRTYAAPVQLTNESALPGRWVEVTYPNDFEGAPALSPGPYRVQWAGAGARYPMYDGGTFTVPPRVEGPRVPHQLTIHLDQHADGSIDLRWSYPYSVPHAVTDQHLRWTLDDLPDSVVDALEDLVNALIGQAEVASVHLPHRDAIPIVKRDVAAFAIQDAAQPDTPAARLFCTVEIPGVAAAKREEVALPETAMTPEVARRWHQLCGWAKARAWEDYNSRFGG